LNLILLTADFSLCLRVCTRDYHSKELC